MSGIDASGTHQQAFPAEHAVGSHGQGVFVASSAEEEYHLSEVHGTVKGSGTAGRTRAAGHAFEHVRLFDAQAVEPGSVESVQLYGRTG